MTWLIARLLAFLFPLHPTPHETKICAMLKILPKRDGDPK